MLRKKVQGGELNTLKHVLNGFQFICGMPLCKKLFWTVTPQDKKLWAKSLLEKIYHVQVTLKHPPFLVVNSWKYVSSVESEQILTQMTK